MKIIAESAYNHNGDFNYLKDLALAAKRAHADFFTVQIMDVAAFCVEDYSKYNIYKENAFKFDEWALLIAFCRQEDIELIPCVLDINSLKFCYANGLNLLKIHATDITNLQMLDYIASKSDIKLILETQCATTLELKFAMDRVGSQVECIIHGFSNYPTEVEDLNLNSIDYLSEYFPEVKVGLADHSMDPELIPVMALAKGCGYLEKHITLTRNNRNFDYQVSLYPFEFSKMVSTIRHYEVALGKKMKHPVKSELPYRNIMYKKFLDNGDFKRSDNGSDYLTSRFNSFNKSNIGIALIARLKSKRLTKKVLRPFNGTILIDYLYNQLLKSKAGSGLFLSTSNLIEDQELVDIAKDRHFRVFQGHDVSVIDRMLELSLREEFGGVFRITGDNPFTDIGLVDEMIDLFSNYNLDYVRVNNVPFGTSAELFSTAYLWKLYLNMDNPMTSEYLTWNILNDDSARKGCIDVDSDIDKLSHINLSIDYPQDLERAYAIIEAVKASGKKIDELSLGELSDYLAEVEREDSNKVIKLPENKEIKFDDFLNLLKNQSYITRKKIKI